MTDNQIDNWNLRHAILMLALILLVLFTERIALLSLGAIISFSSLIHRGSTGLATMYPSGGYANWVTGFRLVLIIIGSFLFSIVSKEIILGIMVSAVLLDGLDGFIARKFKHTSVFGQYFDMEVDAFIVIILCFYYYQYEGIGWWILIPGSLRYLYKVFTSMIPKTTYKEKRRKHASIIAGMFFIILLGALIAPAKVKIPLLVVGVIFIIISFGVSFIEYLRFKPDYKTNG